ncbi:MAG: glucans biosynthesis glucosyltransferase MdoH [Gammaproteobacteria bacterium]|nr:glucans biosynthesis glucosyltransferase MdoH [Gammaproteobacteria bacterium]
MPHKSGHDVTTRQFDGWTASALRRRAVLVALVVLQTILATQYLLEVLPDAGKSWLELGIALLFAVLFAWISMGFWTAFAGFVVTLVHGDRLRITRLEDSDVAADTPLVRTAIIMPIYNEDVSRVFAGLRAAYRALKVSGTLENFDFYVLSDTTNPDIRVEEERAWAGLCREEDAFDRVFYRRRRVNIKRKTGNIADFLRRWGENYRYMVVFDADSVMSARSLERLVRLMEQRREIGIVQTAPLIVNRESLYARIQQFGNHVYGPVFAAGLHYWQLGDGYYWGHNAIIRVKPFMDHCGLGRLSEKGPMGGEILSHDFVEAAFMRRAGWEVWLAYDMDGSYEETPPTLLDELKRDQRWSQGNLQHTRLVHAWGLRFVHRMMFFYGIMAYGSSLLWLILLGFSTADIFVQAAKVPVYFSEQPSLFPVWPIWRPELSLALLGSTAALLFVPKVLSVVLIAIHRDRRRLFGGDLGLIVSMLLEILFSVLLAPVRMLFHARYVMLTMMGLKVSWGAQSREDARTTWSEAVRRHGFGTLLGLVWGAAIYRYAPGNLVWLSPIIGALLLAIPISVISSEVGPGRFTRRLKLFRIPSETRQPDLLRWVDEGLEQARAARERDPLYGFTRAVTDPVTNALHLSLIPQESRRGATGEKSLIELRERALSSGPDALSGAERNALLDDADSMAWLHARVWETTDSVVAAHWGVTSAEGAGTEFGPQPTPV